MSGHGSILTNQEIVDQINAIAKDILPYIQNEEYDNGHILGHNVFQFYSKEAKETADASGLIFGTVIEAQLQEKPTQIYVLVKTFKHDGNQEILLPIRRERALDILYKMKDSKKYIDFVIEKYQGELERKEAEYIRSIRESVQKYGVDQIYSTEVFGGYAELGELLELKEQQKTNHYDAKIQRVKRELRIAKELFEELKGVK